VKPDSRLLRDLGRFYLFPDRAEIRIGRTIQFACHLAISPCRDGHCVLSREHNSYRFATLDSRNGTFVNGARFRRGT